MDAYVEEKLMLEREARLRKAAAYDRLRPEIRDPGRLARLLARRLRRWADRLDSRPLRAPRAVRPA